MSDFILDLATLKPTLNRVEIEAPAAEVGLPEAEWRGTVRASLRVEKTGYPKWERTVEWKGATRLSFYAGLAEGAPKQ